jgi:hypothetical protein
LINLLMSGRFPMAVGPSIAHRAFGHRRAKRRRDQDPRLPPLSSDLFLMHLDVREID